MFFDANTVSMQGSNTRFTDVAIGHHKQPTKVFVKCHIGEGLAEVVDREQHQLQVDCSLIIMLSPGFWSL